MNPARWCLARQSGGLRVVAAALATFVLAAPGATDLEGRAATPLRDGKISVLIYACAIGIATFAPIVSCAIYASVAAMWLVPDRRFEK